MLPSDLMLRKTQLADGNVIAVVDVVWSRLDLAAAVEVLLQSA